MLKSTGKIFILSTLITVIFMQHAVPVQAIMREKTFQTIRNPKYINSLGPENMKQSLKETGSHMLLLDIYANTIIQQPLINFEQIPFENEEILINRIHYHQKQANENAQYWINHLKSQIIQTNQLTLDYQKKFQNYYQVMSDSLNNKDKRIFKEGLENLVQTLSKNREKVTTVIDNLNEFQTKLLIDNQGFNADAEQLEASLAGQDAMIPQIIMEIDSLNMVLQNHWKQVTYSGIGLGFAILGGIVVISIGAAIIVMTGGIALPVVGVLGAGLAMSLAGSLAAGYALNKNLSAIRIVNEKIRVLMEQKNGAQQASISIKFATTQVNTLAQTINLAITSLTQLKNKWTIMEEKYNSLLYDVDDLSIQSLKEDLEIARTGWYELYRLAEQMQTDIIQASK